MRRVHSDHREEPQEGPGARLPPTEIPLLPQIDYILGYLDAFYSHKTTVIQEEATHLRYMPEKETNLIETCKKYAV